MKKYLGALLVLAASVTGYAAIPAAANRLESFFTAFDSNPRQVMNSLPKKYDKDGNLVRKNHDSFTAEDVRSGRFLELKDRFRTNKFDSLLKFSTFAAVNYSNNPTPMLLKSRAETVNALSAAAFSQGKVAVEPWSGDYWPSYRAGIASRYMDQSYPRTSRWKPYEDFFEKAFNVPYRSLSNLDLLSPAEKYDILVGDSAQTMAKWSVNESAGYVSSGSIETWMGLCHGWAVAAYFTDLATQPVSYQLQSGQTLNFFPDDVKALSTLLWANAEVNTSFVGARCNEKNPKTDPDTGRITSPQCWDVNPMAWHVVIANRLGADKTSFVMDATWDYEVWNQPLESYEITYYNPETRKTSKDMQEVMITRNEFKKDKFSKFRAPNTKYVVGVMMDATWVVENSASHSNDPRHVTTTGEYVYDLEIDGSGKVIGGEWYQNAHPDFLWSPAAGSKAMAPVELETPLSWDGISLPGSQIRAAAERSSGQGMPLGAVVNGLLQQSVGH